MTRRQFFYPEKYGISYTWKLTVMRTIVAELMLWALLFLTILPMSACATLLRGQALASGLWVAWKGAWVWFAPLSPVPLLAYVAVAWHFNRHLSGEQGMLEKRGLAHHSASL